MRLSKAIMVDGELREKIGRRRSGRLSSPAIPSTSALGSGRSLDVKLIEDRSNPLDDDLKPIEDSLDLGCLLPSIAEEVILTTGECVETLTSSCCEDDDPVTRPMLSGLIQLPVQVGAVSPSLMPLTRSDELRSFGSTIGEVELGVGIDGPGSLDDGLNSVQAMSMLQVPADELGDSSLMVHCEEGDDLLPRLAGGDLAGRLPIDREELGVLVADGSVEGGQQVRLDVGVALRLPSTDGRQQRPPQPADSSCTVVGAGPDGRGGSGMSQRGGGVQLRWTVVSKPMQDFKANARFPSKTRNRKGMKMTEAEPHQPSTMQDVISK
ncbi:hypothetical protein Dimus_013523 [Dionaea muscipula]